MADAKDNKPIEIAVDFDGTLAFYDHWEGHQVLGEPIPEMVEKVKQALAAGAHVRIFTARVYPGSDYQTALESTESYVLIAEWCKKNFGQMLPIEFAKAKEIDQFWDDRARQVIKNTGMFDNELEGTEATETPEPEVGQ